jgi:holo-[acyl-carrier protein] synthase
MALRVGTDLVLIETVRSSLDTHAEHYLRRVYTEREVQDCTTPDGIDAERLAARFAAKEATLKVLRPRDEGIPWSAIEVRRDSSGWVEVELSGPALALARDGGVSDLALSISHEGPYATAVAIASCSQGAGASVR